VKLYSEADTMGLNIWFPDQIANIILALAETSAMMASVTTDHTEAAEAFHAGYQAALLAVADAVGISLPPLPARCQWQNLQHLSTVRVDSYKPGEKGERNRASEN